MARASQDDFAGTLPISMVIVSCIVFILYIGWIVALTVGVGIVVVGIVSFGWYCTYQAINAPKAALKLTNDPDFGIYNGYVCPVWDHNRLERELEGTDLLLCDNKECPGCHPVTEFKGIPATRCRHWGPSHCKVCRPEVTLRGAPPKGPASVSPVFPSALPTDTAVALQREFYVLQKERPITESNLSRMEEIVDTVESLNKPVDDWVMVEGTEVRRPVVVPAYAHAKWERPDHGDQFNHVVWTWLDQEKGQTIAYKASHCEAWDMFKGGMEKGGRPTWIQSEVVGPVNGRRKAPKIETVNGKRNSLAKKRTTSPGPSAGRIGTDKGYG